MGTYAARLIERAIKLRSLANSITDDAPLRLALIDAANAMTEAVGILDRADDMLKRLGGGSTPSGVGGNSHAGADGSTIEGPGPHPL
jgi:hypothetical protein